MKKWMAGLLAAIVAGVTVYWLTTGIDKRRDHETPPPGSALRVTITAPTGSPTVDVHHKISGTVSDKNANVRVVIHPIETPDCWAQMPAVVGDDGTWSVVAQFGENDPSHSGKGYEVRAFANPRANLSPGPTPCWPQAAANSDALYVTRR